MMAVTTSLFCSHKFSQMSDFYTQKTLVKFEYAINSIF